VDCTLAEASTENITLDEFDTNETLGQADFDHNYDGESSALIASLIIPLLLMFFTLYI
jgi:hypothetical protein